LAPLNRGGLNSTHFHGTHVPVEEPSTASKADIGLLRLGYPPMVKSSIVSCYELNGVGRT
jgi:hypothetical protein